MLQKRPGVDLEVALAFGASGSVETTDSALPTLGPSQPRATGGAPVLQWLQRGLNDSRPGMGAVFGAMDAFVNPGAARARELLDEQHERVIPTPSPGDRMLREGRVVIELPPRPVQPPPADSDD